MAMETGILLNCILFNLRFQVDDEAVLPFSKSPSVSYVFKEKGRRLVRVTARNKFSSSASVVKMIIVDDNFMDVEINCPTVSFPDEDLICKGQWRRRTHLVKFIWGDGLTESALYCELLLKIVDFYIFMMLIASSCLN